jgi:hypothetical protein
MPEFLAETYTPRDAAGTAAPRAGDIARAAEQVSGPGAPVRFLGAIAVPAEETCFWLYQAPTVAAVRAAMAAAGLDPERITPAVTLRPPRPARRRTSRPANPPQELINGENAMQPHTKILTGAAAVTGAAARACRVPILRHCL